MSPVPAWGLFRILRALQERPGGVHLDLRLQDGPTTDATVSIGLKDGRPRCIFTEIPSLSLATHLAHSHAVPGSAIEQYQARARESGVPLCQVLSTERALPPGELARQVEAHTRAVIEALLPMAIPAWSARPHDLCGRACETGGLDAVAILMRTVARHPDTDTMRTLVSRFLGQGEFHLCAGYEVFLSGARAQFHDARILFLLRQGRYGEVAQAVQADERDLRVLFALIAAGAVEHGSARPGAGVRDDAPEDSVSRDLHHAALDFRSRNHYEVLGLSLDCRVSQVEEAGRRLRRRYARARYEATATPRAMRSLDEIHARIDEAVRTLTDPDLRVTYNRTLGAMSPDLIERMKTVFDAYRTWQSGVVALKAGDPREARARFEQAMQQDPEEPLYPMALTRALMTGPDAPKAEARVRELVETVLTRWPDFPEAHVVMAHLLRGQGRKDEAMEHVRTVLRADPDHAEARRLRELLSAKSKPVRFTFQKKPESLFTRLKRKLNGEK